MSVAFIGFVVLIIMGFSRRKKKESNYKKYFVWSVVLLAVSLVSYLFVDDTKFQPTTEELAAQKEEKAQKEKEKEAAQLAKDKEEAAEKAAKEEKEEQKAKEKEEAKLAKEQKEIEENAANEEREKEKEIKKDEESKHVEAKVAPDTKEETNKNKQTEKYPKENIEILKEHWVWQIEESKGLIRNITTIDPDDYEYIIIYVNDSIKNYTSSQKEEFANTWGNKVKNSVTANLYDGNKEKNKSSYEMRFTDESLFARENIFDDGFSVK